LRVTVKDEETKWKILKQAKNLTHSREEKFKTIFLKKDMTPTERQQDAELRKNLKEKKEQEERDNGTRRWIISKGRIVARRM